MSDRSPFWQESGIPLDPDKFKDPLITAKAERRAHVRLDQLKTLWLNTGTLCNLACKTCYIESSPRNDALVYLKLSEAEEYLDEAKAMGTVEIGFTGGEPFMNPDIIGMLEASLDRGFKVLVLTNAMRPMRRFEEHLLDLRSRFGGRLTFRVSVDHHRSEVHEAERGPRSWQKTIDGLCWLSANGFSLAVAGRSLPGESEIEAQSGYAALFGELGVAVDAGLLIFPQMDVTADVAEISEDCWEILNVAPSSVMCASSRMVVKRKGAAQPEVIACTLLPYDEEFSLGRTLRDATGEVALNHPHCARFCVLGGASCSA
ncbi:MAG: radical SAM protein [Sphingomonas sp.]|nr:radical SAM protein [Sphingomonas sp.]